MWNSFHVQEKDLIKLKIILNSKKLKFSPYFVFFYYFWETSTYMDTTSINSLSNPNEVPPSLIHIHWNFIESVINF